MAFFLGETLDEENTFHRPNGILSLADVSMKLTMSCVLVASLQCSYTEVGDNLTGRWRCVCQSAPPL